MKKAVLLNDTSYENHHGCNIVIKNIKAKLAQRDIDLIATNPIGKEWQTNTLFLKALSLCDIVLINAEGTIHHDSPYALSLLQIVTFTNKPTVLLNMTYQNNSHLFADLVKSFTKVYVRESLSQAELSKYAIDVPVVPDMTFASSYIFANTRTFDICMTDSHDIQFSQRLHSIAKKQHFCFLPIISPYLKYSTIKGFVKKIKYGLIIRFRKYIQTMTSIPYSYLRYTHVLPEKNFIQKIGESHCLVSARFHALCIAMQTMTPFLILKSNTHKIEGLLSDAKITSTRIIDLNTLEDALQKPLILTEEEQTHIRNYLADAQRKIDTMFDEIASLLVQ